LARGKTTVSTLSDIRPLALEGDLPMSSSSDTTSETFRSADGSLSAGTWAHAGGILHIQGDYDEVCILLAGHVRLTSVSGYTAEFKAGETFVIPKGFQGTWETVEPVRKHYVIFEPAF
jgi:uncharacterized cupin superfamily protein